MKVDVEVRGLRELDRALDEIPRDLADEMAPGFVPIRRYRGLGGIPFTADAVELVGRRLGFLVRGSGF